MQNLKSYKQPAFIDFGNWIDVLMTDFRDFFSQSLLQDAFESSFKVNCHFINSLICFEDNL